MRGSDGWSPTRLASRWASPLNRTRCRARLAARFPSGDGRGRRLPGMGRPGDSQWGSVGYMPVTRCGEVLLTPKPCYSCASPCFVERAESVVRTLCASLGGRLQQFQHLRAEFRMATAAGALQCRGCAFLHSVAATWRRRVACCCLLAEMPDGDANQSIVTRMSAEAAAAAAAAAADSRMATATCDNALHVLCVHTVCGCGCG